MIYNKTVSLPTLMTLSKIMFQLWNNTQTIAKIGKSFYRKSRDTEEKKL